MAMKELLEAHLRRLHTVAKGAHDHGRQGDKAADAGGVVALRATAVKGGRWGGGGASACSFRISLVPVTAAQICRQHRCRDRRMNRRRGTRQTWRQASQPG